MATPEKDDFDSPWKSILGKYFQECLEFFLPNIANQINWIKGYEILDKELRKITKDAANNNMRADLLVKLWSKSGKEIWLIAHVELQAQQQAIFPERMYVYRYRASDHFKKPILSVAILADDNPNWRPQSYREDVFGSTLEMHFHTIKLLDYQHKQDELEQSNNPFALVIKAHLGTLATKNDLQKRLNFKITLTRSLYDKGWNKQEILDLYHFLDWILALSPPLELQYRHAVQEIEEAYHVQYITTAERIGIEKGIQRGRQEGEHALLMRLLKHKFHQVPESYTKKLTAANSEELLSWGERVLDAKTIEDVFKD